MTSKYRESDKRADGSWCFRIALAVLWCHTLIILQVEHTFCLQSPVTTLTCSQSPRYWSPAPVSTHQLHYICTLSLLVRSTVHYTEQFLDPVCTYLCILTFSDSRRSSSDTPTKLIHCCWFPLSSDPATTISYQYSAKTLWTISITKILTCHLLLSSWFPLQSINYPVILLTCCLWPRFVTVRVFGEVKDGEY